MDDDRLPTDAKHFFLPGLLALVRRLLLLYRRMTYPSSKTSLGETMDLVYEITHNMYQASYLFSQVSIGRGYVLVVNNRSK